MEPGTVHELSAAYALDALDADEAEEFEAHLAQCESCRAELPALNEAAVALAWAVESPSPPAGLRDSILEAAAAERANVVPLPTRNPWLFRSTAAAAAVAACAAIGLGVWAATLSNSLSNQRSKQASEVTAVQILADPATRRVKLNGRRGVVAVDPAGQGVLVVQRLPSAASGKTYEAWVIPAGGKPKSAGLFRGGGPQTVVKLSRTVPRGAVVAATLERAGGVSAPTQTPFLSARA
jgi:anti-sigma-K factor RskA